MSLLTDARQQPDSSVEVAGFWAGRVGGTTARFFRGQQEDAAWVRPALLALLTSTGALYLVGLARSGWANGYYSGAVFAGTKSWRAMFFGSLDPGNLISVDKPPVSLWFSDLAARVFGLNPWSILVPQALEGICAVALLYATVRRQSTALGGLLASAILATTPVATLMFRYNNPDALLVLILVAAAYVLTRAIESGRTGWVVAAGALLGTGFLVKLMQAFLVLPPFALAYLVGAPGNLGRRVRQVLIAGVVLLASAGWWVCAVALTPPSGRPYVGGSQTNSILELTLGYNGFGRLTGNERGSAGSTWGATGGGRLFGDEMGTQVSWLLPTALVLLAVLAWRYRRVALRSRRWSPLVIWGGWLLVTAAVFSYAHGIVHPYYTVALAPAIAAVIGIGLAYLWSERSTAAYRVLAGCVALTAAWAIVLLGRTPYWQPWMRPFVLVGGLVAAAILFLGRVPRHVCVAGGLAVLVCLTAPLSYAIQTASAAHRGAIPAAGPPVVVSVLHLTARTLVGNAAPETVRVATSPAPSVAAPTSTAALRSTMGGLIQISRPGPGAVQALLEDADSYRWVAATPGGNNAAGLELATRRGVIGLGGFNATDPAPTLAQFQRAVAAHEVHYFVADDTFPYPIDEPAAEEIAVWVEENFSYKAYGDLHLYDLSSRGTGS